MRKYIVLALILLVTGIGISIYLIPTTREVAGMQNADMQAIDLGKVDVEAEYAQGRRTYPIIAALADKRIAEGKREEAIKILEEYALANPTDANGHKKLAEQYLAAGNMAGYSAQLDAIATSAPTEENLRMLSDLYNASKEYAKQAEVLKKLVEVTKGEQAQTFVDLATIQVVLGDSDAALKTVEDLKVKHPNFSSYPMTRIMVSVLADKGQADRAFDIAKEWMATVAAPVPAAVAPVAAAADATAPVAPVANVDGNPRPKELADLCNILHYAGQADKAVALVDLYIAMLDNEPELVLAYVNASVTAGKSEQAYQVLKKIDDAGTMVASLYPPYLDLTIKREDMPAAEAIATKLNVATFSEIEALNLIETARANNAPTVLTTLTSRFGDAVIVKDKPVLDAVIAILTNTKGQDTKIEAALNIELTSTQKLRLAESCARAKKTACFDAIVKQYPPLEQMSPTQVAEYSQLFIIAERQAELVDPVGKLATVENSAAVVKTAHRRLAAAAGRHDVLKPWLETNANAVPIRQLQELFYLANDRKHGEVSSDIAERLYARDPSPMNRDIMVSAYINAGAYEKAVPLLREQVQDVAANDGLYLSTLSKLARKDATYRKELADYAQAALTAGHGDDRAQLNYAYVLINNGRKADVIPFAKNFASERGGEWKKMYAQLTFKPKTIKGGVAVAPVKLTREQMVAMANGKSISAENRRQIAFNLLNDGYKADAVAIFKDLAKDKPADSQEVKDLMFLWGGKLNGEQLAWVQSRAASATAYDKERWSSLITNTADDNSVLAYVSATPDALYNRDLRKKYFNILANTGNRKNYDGAMRDWVSQTTDVPALLDYATIGQNSGFREAAIHSYSRVLQLDANNKKALSAMAALDFSKGKFREADQKLTQYIASQQQTPDPETNPSEAHFYKAQLARRAGDKNAANTEFQQVVALTAQAGATSPDALSRMYTAQFHLGQHADAKAGFNQLLEQYPDDKGVLADYMSVLIEYQYLDEATRVANQYDKTSPYYRKGASLVGRSAHTASVQQFSNGREMKISFAQPIEGAAPINMDELKKQPWVEHSSADYDSVSISAKPGYAVRYVPTSEQQFAVVATEQPNYAPQVEAQRQQDLRLQLLYARIEQESGQIANARARIAALKNYYPNDPLLLSYEASVESATGNNAAAMNLISQARAAAPENEDFTLQAQNIANIGQGTNYVKLDHEFRGLGDNREHVTTLSSVVHAGDRAEFGITAQNNQLDSKNIRRASDGAIGDYDTSRQRGEVYAAYNLPDGSRAQASLFANNKDVGAGAYYAFNNPAGRTELIGEYQRPYWDFVEAVYEHATRDRIGAKHFTALRPGTTLGLEASYNNYNIDEKSSVAQTVLLRANVVQELQKQTATQPYFGIGYGFDGEYRTGKPDAGLDAFSNDYFLLPVQTREVHALTGIYRHDWTPQTHALLVGGVAYDRINGGVSPLGEVRVDHDITDQLQVGGRARYAQEANNTDNQAFNLGADVLYKF